jgi:Na+-transporting methylmalonyl-CoA/oxaloacetate decarboxylase gamma subunit
MMDELYLLLEALYWAVAGVGLVTLIIYLVVLGSWWWRR